MREGLELNSYLTSAADGGGYQLHAPVALPPGRAFALPGWASEPVWTFWKKIFSPLRGIEPRFVGSAARSL